MPTNYATELLEFEKNGYVFIPDLLDKEETELLFAAAKADPQLMSNAFDIADTQGGKSRLRVSATRVTMFMGWWRECRVS